MWAVNENESKCIIAIILKGPSSHFSFLSEKYFMFHVITEEPSQHVWSDSAFASQNLKFAAQMFDDRR